MLSCFKEIGLQPRGKRTHLIIPLSVKRDKTFPPQSTWLSTLCTLFLPTLPSGLYSVSCSVNIICRPWSRQAQKQTLLLSCRWLMWLWQEAATIPLHSLPSSTSSTSSSSTTTEPCLLHNTDSLSLSFSLTNAAFFWDHEEFSTQRGICVTTPYLTSSSL